MWKATDIANQDAEKKNPSKKTHFSEYHVHMMLLDHTTQTNKTKGFSPQLLSTSHDCKHLTPPVSLGLLLLAVKT